MTCKYFLASLAILFLNSCGSQKQDPDSVNGFMGKYGNSDFEQFRNYSVFVRSYENRGKDACIMVVNSRDTGTCRLPYTLVMEKSSLQVLELRNSESRDQHCNLDTSVARKLAMELLKMDIHGIGMDTNANVFVNIEGKESGSAELVRFSDKKFITGIYQKNYKPIGNNWYKRTE